MKQAFYEQDYICCFLAQRLKILPLSFHVIIVQLFGYLLLCKIILGWSIANFSHHIEVHHRCKQVSTSSTAMTAFLQRISRVCFSNHVAHR